MGIGLNRNQFLILSKMLELGAIDKASAVDVYRLSVELCDMGLQENTLYKIMNGMEESGMVAPGLKAGRRKSFYCLIDGVGLNQMVSEGGKKCNQDEGKREKYKSGELPIMEQVIKRERKDEVIVRRIVSEKDCLLEELSFVPMELLTQDQRWVIEERRKGLLFEDIGKQRGLSKQAIHSKITRIRAKYREDIQLYYESLVYDDARKATIGERLRTIRKYLGMGSDQFAREINMFGIQIINVENGECEIPERMLERICEDMYVRREWLLTGEGDPFIEYAETLRKIHKCMKKEGNAYRKELYRYISGLTDGECEQLYKYIE